jgi:hypothetical protein
MSGIQALAAAAAATSKINTPGTATTLTTSSGQAIKLIQQPGINYLKGQNSFFSFVLYSKITDHIKDSIFQVVPQNL